MIKDLLFIGPLKDGSTSISRLNALKELQINVFEIDTSNWLSSSYWFVNSFIQRTYLSLYVLKINKKIKNAINNQYFQIIWIEKGEYIYPSTLKLAKGKNIFLINYNTDNIFLRKGNFWLHNLGIKFYNLYLTTNRLNVIDIKVKYNINVFRVSMGYDKNFEDTNFKFNQKIYDIVFIGHWEPHTEEYIELLHNNGLNIKIWGHNWSKANNPAFRNIKPLEQKFYIETISKAKIALCFLSRWNKNESTGRSFEIPAIGSFILAQKTLEHVIIYDKYSNAILFNNKNELLQKVKYFLKNNDEREALAIELNRLIKNYPLSWQDNLKREWPIILNYYNKNLNIKMDNFLWEGYRDGILYNSHDQ